MSLPLIERAGDGDVRFELSRPWSQTPQAVLYDIAPLAAEPRMPTRVLSPGEQYRFHFEMTQCIG